MTANLVYDNPLISRYASKEMAELWGPQRKFSTWRRLWLALAETQAELGLSCDDKVTPRIRPEQLDELRNHLDDIDFNRASEFEKRMRHDVMAHIHTLAEAAPCCRDIIHLGATSCFVTDNTDLIFIREGLQRIRDSVVGIVASLARFAQQFRNLPCLGYTHFQPAQITTVGKRACLWCHDFVLDVKEIEHRLQSLKFRGAKGTTGTQASFLALFHGDQDLVRELDRRVAKKMGFDEVYAVTGQTYSRKIDSQVMEALSGIATSAAKFATDLRLLAHENEIDEPFESEQIGSSAMAYKRNPMRSERVCGLARFVNGLPAMAAQTAANQWLERSLDDSAIRRLYLPQGFLAADAIVRLIRNIADGMRPNPAVIARHISDVLPFMVTENILMAAVARGADRQKLHEVIRQHSLATAAEMKAGAAKNTLLERLKNDPAFATMNFGPEIAAEQYFGRAPQQVDEFLREVVEPLLRSYPQPSAGTQSADLEV